MNKGKFVEEQAFYWAKKFKINNLQKVRISKHLKKFLAVAWWEKKELVCSSKWLPKYTKNELIHLVFHELGHFKNKVQHFQKGGSINSEYLAEKFALKNIKKYLPNYYKEAIKNTKYYIGSEYKKHSIAFEKVLKELGEIK